MFTSMINNSVKGKLVVLAGIVIASVGYGFSNVQSQPVQIWGKDASGNVVLFPRNMTLDVASTTGKFGSMELNDCISFTLNPGSMSSSTSPSSSQVWSGLATQSKLLASLDSATSSDQYHVVATVKNTGSAALSIIPYPGTPAWNDGLDLSTSTAEICRFK
jgi:hypothetical protein